MSNPFFELNYEPAFESLGNDYYDEVPVADFPQHILRFRNNELLPKINLNPQTVTDADFIDTFGKFIYNPRPFLAMRYHGYQFGEYNPNLGDGRGFLYGQIRGIDGKLYDLGTKGSGRTPYSRNADGRLTLKGGVREVLAAEMLHRLGVTTSRCLSMIETGESLWRGDEPSPTRSCVMVRFSSSHIRFGTFERLHYFRRPDLIQKLLDHVIDYYYPEIHLIVDQKERSARFYAELVKRVAQLAAQWMSVGFCHGVLNTDNMSITGESFDYGPYAFIPNYNPQFTAAYFDYFSLYSYGNQPQICRLNLERLQAPLGKVIEPSDLDAGLAQYNQYYLTHYRQLMLRRLGFENLPDAEGNELLELTLKLLKESAVGYHDFFVELRNQFDLSWRDDINLIFPDAEPASIIKSWREFYYHLLQTVSFDDMKEIGTRLTRYNPQQSLIRPEIEAIWEPIAIEDNWQPFYELLKRVKND